MANEQIRARPKKNKPISLHPLEPKEVLAALLKTPPPTERAPLKEEKGKNAATE